MEITNLTENIVTGREDHKIVHLFNKSIEHVIKNLPMLKTTDLMRVSFILYPQFTFQSIYTIDESNIK